MRSSTCLLLATALAAAACTAAPRAPAAATAASDPAAVPSSTIPTLPFPAAPAPAASALRTQTRPLPRDLALLRGLRGIAISRDGARVAYVVRTPTHDATAKPSADDSKGGWSSTQQLYVIDRAGGTPRQLTFGDDPVSSPRFSPDGTRIAFLRPRAGKPAVHILDLAGGEPRAVDLGTHAPHTVDWAPAGDALVFTGQQPAADDLVAQRWSRGGAYRYDVEHEPERLFVAPLTAAGTAGPPRLVGPAEGSLVAHAWSPDGTRIAMIVARTADPTDGFAHHALHVIGATAGAPVIVERSEQPLTLAHLAWSADSKRLAYAAGRRGPSHLDELLVTALDGAKPTNLTKALDPTLLDVAWASDGRSLLALTFARTATKLYRVPLAGGAAREIPTGDTTLYGFDADRSGRYLAGGASTATAPGEPVLVDVERGTVRTLVALNPQVREWTHARSEVVRWTSPEGTQLEGVLTVTPHATAGTPPPLIVLPHGGPDFTSLHTFSTWAQLLAARGYSVFEPNYRGGLGYGRAFYEANRGRLGEIEQLDIESGVDALIASKRADPTRLFFAGWSWGGYLSAWALGHTQRYRAFMVGAGISDVVVQYATSDINHGAAADWEFTGRPWSKPEAFVRANPAAKFAAAKAPTLIIHGTEDARVPFVNAQLLYRALHDVGVPVTMWAYPREPHGFGEPAHIEHMFSVWMAFFDAQLPR